MNSRELFFILAGVQFAKDFVCVVLKVPKFGLKVPKFDRGEQKIKS
jgi:hypothetical protein